MIYAILEYSKLPVTIQSYAKARSYAKDTGDLSYQKGKSRAWRRTDAANATATTPEQVPVLKTNTNGTFNLDGKFYPLKAFVTEDIYLGRLQN